MWNDEKGGGSKPRALPRVADDPDQWHGQIMKKTIFPSAAAALLLVTATSAVAAALAPDPHLESLAAQVLTASGNDARLSAINRGLAEQDLLLKALHAALPAATPSWEPVMRTAVQAETQAEADAFFKENVRIYATYFTEAELKDMLAFYNTPGGKALVAKTPAIIQEKIAFGRRLGVDGLRRMIDAVCAKEQCPAR
jgi:hypothetical protein